MLARKAATAVVAEFIMTQSISPVAERVHFSPRRQDLAGECLHAPLSAGIGATQAETRDYSHQNVVSSNHAR